MRNIKLTLKFVGTNYHGWQIQENGITIQECMRDAIYAITGEKVTVIGCGRTDSGVHAEKYVASFKTESRVPTEKFSYALNTKLPEDIVCISAEEASENFDAARCATSKCYTYRIYNSDIRNPFYSPYSYLVKQSLDVDKMTEASKHFIGTHDFIGFASSGFTVKTTIRTIYNIEITKCDNLISIAITGDGFLYNMVRIIAGTLIKVGMGAILPSDIPEIILSRDRERAGITAPANGLCLTEVYYNG